MTTVFQARNVTEALVGALQAFTEDAHMVRSVAPRGMVTLEWDGPVVTDYDKPLERVVFIPERDANPFFHFFESLWMLAGRNDLAFLTFLLPSYAKFSDDGVTVHGAYGHRMRGVPEHNEEHGIHWNEQPGYGSIDTWCDQLARAIALLKADPDTRRVVVQLWDYRVDLQKMQSGKDVPCNTQLYFKVREGKLQMTITCRSNDMLWGAYGANAVHFSMIMEYVANKVGVEVGTMHQLSDSFHVYLDGPGGELWNRLKGTARGGGYDDVYAENEHYGLGVVRPYPMGADHPDWDRDLLRFFELWRDGLGVQYETIDSPTPQYVAGVQKLLEYGDFKTPFFRTVVTPFWNAFTTRERGWAEYIEASDWRRAVLEWLQRRDAAKEAKNVLQPTA